MSITTSKMPVCLKSTYMLHCSRVPGGFDPNLKGRYHDIAHAMWCYDAASKRACHGKVIHSVYITAAGDLVQIISGSRNSFFHNLKYGSHSDGLFRGIKG